MARVFKKLYNLQKETLDDDFPELEDDKIGPNLGFKVIGTMKHVHGSTIKATAYKHPSGNSVEGTLEPEFKFSDYITVKGKYQTNNKFETTLSLNDQLAKGSTIFATGKCELAPKGTKTSFELGVEYLNKEKLSANLKFITPSSFDSSKFELYGNFTGYYEGVSVGGEVKANISSQDLSIGNGFIQYDNSDQSIALFRKYDLSKGINKAGFGYFRHINSHLKGALEVAVDVSDYSNTVVKVGGDYNLHSDGSSSIKPRLSLYGTDHQRIGFVYKHKVSPNVKLTVASDLNVNTLLDQKVEKSKGHQFGVTLSFFD